MTGPRGSSRLSTSLGANDPRARRNASALQSFGAVAPLLFNDAGELAIEFPDAGLQHAIRWDGRSVVAQPEYIVVGTKTSAYTAKPFELVLCDPTSAGFTVTLPGAAKCKGARVTIKNASTSVNTITVACQGSEKVDGGTTLSMGTSLLAKTLVSDGSGWWSV